MHVFEFMTMTWALLSAAKNDQPAARFKHGFTSAGGKLYMHGGSTYEG